VIVVDCNDVAAVVFDSSGNFIFLKLLLPHKLGPKFLIDSGMYSEDGRMYIESYCPTPLDLNSPRFRCKSPISLGCILVDMTKFYWPPMPTFITET